jgi:hypothetical protein
MIGDSKVDVETARNAGAWSIGCTFGLRARDPDGHPAGRDGGFPGRLDGGSQSCEILLGLAGCAWLLPGPRVVYGIEFDVHTLLYAFVAVLLGFQFVSFAVFTKVFAISEGLLPEDARLNRVFRYITLEVGLIAGALLVAFGIGGSIFAVSGWAKESFGVLDAERMLRIVMPSVFSLTLGVQIICASFFLSILGLRRR